MYDPQRALSLIEVGVMNGSWSSKAIKNLLDRWRLGALVKSFVSA